VISQNCVIDKTKHSTSFYYFKIY